MPGANCSIFGCNVSRNKVGIAIFKVAAGKDDYSANWRSKLVDIITKNRVIDTQLRKQIENRKLHICERHFTEDCLNHHPSKTTLVPGSIPTLCLPQKSLPSSSTTTKPRDSAETIAQKRSVLLNIAAPAPSFYKNYEDFLNRVHKLKLPEAWNIFSDINNVKILKQDGIHVLPHFEIIVDTELQFSVNVYMWKLPDDHKIYVEYKRTVRNITLSNLIISLSSYQLCNGISNIAAAKSGFFLNHSIPKFVNTDRDTPDLVPIVQTEFNRTFDCQIIITQVSSCKNCVTAENKELKSLKRKAANLNIPAKLKAPISLTSPERVKLTLQNYRMENKMLKLEVEKLQAEISRSSMTVSPDLNNDFMSIMSSTESKNISPFMKLFWEEQQKYLKSSKTGIRYHPMIIRYCLALASKSSAAYDEIRYDENTGTGFVILPSRRRLRDYKNYIRPERGFNKEIFKELNEKVKYFTNIEKYVVLLLDEMKIQENLVWDKHTGELIGYVDLGDTELNYASLQKVDEIATHVLSFLIRSIVNPFKFSLANFATTGATSYQMFPLYWKAVSICELQCNLKVVALTCDGASTNRKLFRMHANMTEEEDMNPDVDVTYRISNPFSSEKRYIYFISDPPHLIKTARNCLSNSGAGRCTRYMWNNFKFILWSHITDLFYEDRECGLQLLPKLTYEHVKLTPYSVMNVKLAAQVLSSSVSKVLEHFGPADATGTAEFCSLMDTFFDIVNIRNTKEAITKQKTQLAEFRSTNDPRFLWLTDVFLKYFED